MFFLEPSLLEGRLLTPGAFDPGFGLDEDIVWSGHTMPHRTCTIPNKVKRHKCRGARRNVEWELLGGGGEVKHGARSGDLGEKRGKP